MKPSDSKENRSERVRMHRLKKRIRPQTPVSSDADPWEIANQALILMTAAKAGLRNPRLVAKQDEAMELIRQLAWGDQELD